MLSLSLLSDSFLNVRFGMQFLAHWRGAPPRIHALRLCTWLLLAGLLGGCGKQPTLSRLAPDAVVLAFGDSLTHGTGANEAQSYPVVLEGLIGRQVVRAGVPGEVSAAGLARLPALLEEHKPRLLILCHGGNDFLRRMDRGQAAQNVRAMVREARSRGIEVVLLAPPEPGFTLTPPAFYEDIAKEFRIPFEGSILGKILRDSSLKADAVHPNGQGYALIASRLAELLKKSGAV